MRNQRGRLFAGALLAMAFLPGFDCGSPSGGGADAGMTGATGCVGGCPGGQTCVAGHAGAICVADCASSIDCPATCCVMTQQGAHVCAPDSTYCTTRPPAGGCSPACPNGYECVTAQGAAVCLANCASDGDCPNTCCVGVTNGTRVCAPTRSSCATPSSC